MILITNCTLSIKIAEYSKMAPILIFTTFTWSVPKNSWLVLYSKSTIGSDLVSVTFLFNYYASSQNFRSFHILNASSLIHHQTFVSKHSCTPCTDVHACRFEVYVYHNIVTEHFFLPGGGEWLPHSWFIPTCSSVFFFKIYSVPSWARNAQHQYHSHNILALRVQSALFTYLCILFMFHWVAVTLRTFIHNNFFITFWSRGAGPFFQLLSRLGIFLIEPSTRSLWFILFITTAAVISLLLLTNTIRSQI